MFVLSLSTAQALRNLAGVVLMRGVFSAKGPDSSVGGVPVVYCPDDDHMEEEVPVEVPTYPMSQLRRDAKRSCQRQEASCKRAESGPITLL